MHKTSSVFHIIWFGFNAARTSAVIWVRIHCERMQIAFDLNLVMNTAAAAINWISVPICKTEKTRNIVEAK